MGVAMSAAPLQRASFLIYSEWKVNLPKRFMMFYRAANVVLKMQPAPYRIPQPSDG